ncbi:hypothetical protein D3C77_602250 [compost metagenome]
MADTRQQARLRLVGSLRLRRRGAQLGVRLLERIDVDVRAGQHARQARLRIVLQHPAAAEQPVVLAERVGKAVFDVVALRQPLLDQFELSHRPRQVLGVNALAELLAGQLPLRQAEAP